MGWFDEQIKQRKKNDVESFEDSCLQIAGSIMGRKYTAALHDDREKATDAIGDILKYYHVRGREVPEKLQNIDEVLDYLLRPSGIMTREVTLKEGWRKDASGAMLTTFEENSVPVALIPAGVKGYVYIDKDTGYQSPVSEDSEKLFSKSAIAFYKPFPNEKLGLKELFKYIIGSVNKRTLMGYFAFTAIATLVGLIIPPLTKNLFSSVMPYGNMTSLLAVAVFMICASVGKIMFEMVQGLILSKISLQMSYEVESAAMMRILTLPSSFFKKYSSGDLGNRMSYLTLLVQDLVDFGFAGFVMVLFSVIYIFQILSYAPSLAVPAFVVTLLVLLINIFAVRVKGEIGCRQMELNSKEIGMSYAFVSGIEKIRLSGAERRAFSKWGKRYADQAELLYNPPLFAKVYSAITRIIPLIGTIVIYYTAVRSHISVGEYYAFNAAFGIVVGQLANLELIIVPASQVKPILDMVRPITETLPEAREDKTVLDRISGGIELNNVTFRYQKNMPDVLKNINLKIKPGQYVAITGKTGCGKSTLMRLMLGFEVPDKGAVYYDGRDLNGIDLKSLRSKIGTVLQNSQLFLGDIYSNIVISDPSLTLDEAWEAAEMAGLADDIRGMPMGMFTVIGEGTGGISGGQKQRMMIARAVAPKPKILMFDEATSALDNITQKQVSDSLDNLKCTRVVIAHRLSTIRNCDRIIVLDEGRIVEDGNYDELMAKNGYFAELVKRQQVSMNE
ncbi:MAG: NHLP bacteriocin export ABC transporter permease/ATPase subunit [Lachnospiraceae bacterium]|nr:NHLP bacteriocin export ABC transporter permease/ATPase subunit [Lachnospiraceae bacterium]